MAASSGKVIRHSVMSTVKSIYAEIRCLWSFFIRAPFLCPKPGCLLLYSTADRRFCQYADGSLLLGNKLQFVEQAVPADKCAPPCTQIVTHLDCARYRKSVVIQPFLCWQRYRAGQAPNDYRPPVHALSAATRRSINWDLYFLYDIADIFFQGEAV